MVKQSKMLTLVKYIVVSVAIYFLSVLILKTIGNLNSLQLFVFAAFTFFIGYLAADLLTGTIHWFCDTFFSEKTPVIGPFIIFSFREHHTQPHLITEDKFIEQDTTSFFVLLIPLISAVYSDSIYPQNLGSYLFHTALIGLSIGAFSTNLFHKWAHMDSPPKLIRKFQNMGLILNRERHKIHHANHSRSFCVTSGLLNPLLDKLRFFQVLEYLIRLFAYESRT